MRRLSEAFLLKIIIDTISTQSPSQEVSSLIITYLILYISLQFVLEIINRSSLIISDKVASKSIEKLYNSSYNHITNLSYDFFQNNMSGSIVAKIKRIVDSISNLYYAIQFDIFSTGILILTTLIALTIQSLYLGVAMFIFLIIYIWLSVFINLKAAPYFEKPAEYNSKVSGILNDNISNILTIQTFGKTKQEESSFQKLVRKYADLVFQKMKVSELINASQVFFMISIELVTWLILINGWQNKLFTAGDMIFVQQLLLACFHRLWGLGSTVIKINTSVFDAKEMLEIFEIKSSLNLSHHQTKKFKVTKGSLTFQSVNFAYNQNQDVLTNFNLTIPAGQKVGIVGHSGSGKSTLIKLILRLMDPNTGQILCDDKNIQHIEPNTYRSQISYVPQDPSLFHRTILENIRYSNPKATLSQIKQTIQKAHADEFIGQLPQGLDSLVGERGVKLSGGERQRIAIARAMLEPTKILILDEATSALDSISEKYIQDSFQALMQGRTTIVIAHRLSTIMQLDRILVMENGKIVEDGSHQELLNQKGKYHQLWSHQNNGFLIE